LVFYVFLATVRPLHSHPSHLIGSYHEVMGDGIQVPDGT
jgi:hypothetical protein